MSTDLIDLGHQVYLFPQAAFHLVWFQDPAKEYTSQMTPCLSNAARDCLIEEFRYAENAAPPSACKKTFLKHELQLLGACHIQNKSWGDLKRTEYKYHVFLGGACNPTTWRVDTAIPILEEHDITYCNPQVKEWSEEMVKIEAEAKSTSVVFLYVFETWRTRAISSFVEAASLAGRNARVVFVISNTSGSDPPLICNERISDMEYAELKEALYYLQHLARIRGLSVFYDLEEGLNYVIEIVKEHRIREDRKARYTGLMSDEELSVLSRVESVCQVFRSLRKCESGRVTLEEARLGLLRLGLDLPCVPSNWTESKTLSFEQFCQAYTAYVLEHCGDHSDLNSPLLADYQPCNFTLDLYLGSSELSRHTDVDSTLRLLIDSYREVLPSLRTNLQVDEFCPCSAKQTEENLRFCARIRAHSRLLLYYVDSSSFSVRTMMEASFAIGSGRKAVLCVESLGDRIRLRDFVDPPIESWNSQPSARYRTKRNLSSDKRKLDGLMLHLSHRNVQPSLPPSPLTEVHCVSGGSESSEHTGSAGSRVSSSTNSSPLAKLDNTLPWASSSDSGVSSNPSQSSSPDPASLSVLDSLSIRTPSPCLDTDSHALTNRTGSNFLLVSQSAINDYNRGRRYLQSVCDEYHLPTTSNLKDAIDKCFSILYPNSVDEIPAI
ncbi:hypothetical protein T265_04001 [Opisthorchis viverrini]|uniref:Uncharacterized protein n=2 Tax=Opisthorchis viverrini TaxID=6198 RepID=A0A075AH41_OPIVI|nr:hypothetical protein T265_04001 [Opisthorchis viverrini]KER29339.1 hypothetical protein T265_04001 [Opisthorchis viverrini]